MTKYFLTLLLLIFPSLPAFGQQLPPVGIIDFYGLRTVSEKDVRSVLKIKIGDDAIETMKSVEENRRLLKQLPNVEDAAVGLVCCDDATGKSIIFVGIREKGTPVLQFRTPPNGPIRLPETILKADREFQTAFMAAVAAQDFSEDDSQGHTLANNKNVRKVQESFIGLATRNLKILRRVLRESGDAAQRAMAAQIIAYHPNKKAIVGDLIYGAGDANESARNNATRALIILANYAQIHPKSGIKIPADDFIRMLNSLDWTDRNKSVGLLEALTRSRNPALFSALKKNALDALVEMARWKSEGHAQSSFSILGRLANFSENEIADLWKSTDRAAEIDKMAAKIGANSK